ncbi:MAG: DUF2207 domain-containing protein [Fimbriimonadaceae bacterium]|nr:DUF2207 domain-containing protein [Fimbriimonadaceae bacterium]
MMRRVLVAWVLLLASLLAQAANFTTQRFDVDVQIRPDSTLDVTENISVTFSVPQRGLIRRIPFQVSKPDGAVVRRGEFSIVSVEQNAGKGFVQSQIATSFEGDFWNIRIGNPKITLRGAVTYRIRYQAKGYAIPRPAEGKLPPRVEFNWNAIGSQWPTSIGSAKVGISFPPGDPKGVLIRAVTGKKGERLALEGFEGGPYGGRSDLLSIDFAPRKPEAPGSLTIVAKKGLALNEGLSFVIGVPPNSVRVPAMANAITPEQSNLTPLKSPYPEQPMGEIPQSPWGFLIPLSAVPLAYLFYRTRPTPKMGPLVTRFEPPDGLGPGECGLLIDEKFQPRDVVAAMVSLAQKGAANIQVEGQRYETMAIHLIGKEHARGLTSLERELYDNLLPYAPEITPVTLRGAFAAAFARMETHATADMIQRGLLRPGGISCWGAGCVTFPILLMITFFSCLATGYSSLLGAMVAFAVGVWLFRRMSKLTPSGGVVKSQILGLREFIARANEDQLKAMTTREPNQALFEELLPYAVAFGLVKQWAGAFKGLDVHPPVWYAGSDVGDMLWATHLADSFNTFERSYSEAVSYDPPSPRTSSWSSSSDSGSDWSSGSSGFSSSDFGSGSSDSGSSVDSGGGGGGGDSW